MWSVEQELSCLVVVRVRSQENQLEVRSECGDLSFVGLDDVSEVFTGAVTRIRENALRGPELGAIVVLIHEVWDLVIQINYKFVGVGGLL